MIRVLALFILIVFSCNSFSQGILGGRVTGNFQMDVQVSKQDSLIGAGKVDEKLLNNAFGNVLYTNGDFSAGMRFEAYLNPILGFDPQYKGAGIGYRFISYKKDFLEFTLGNYYEQFGNGLIFRSYEERNLGLDNAMDGVRVIARPYKGITIKGIIGKQRKYWEKIWENDNFGLVRGIDGELSLNSLIKPMQDSKFRIDFGGSFISLYQKANSRYINSSDGSLYQVNIPENIGAGAARLVLNYEKWNLNAEYAYKGQDPNAVNGYIFSHGDAFYVSTGYSQKGLGINISAKRIDNMSFKSNRDETGNMLNINYLPALTRQHAYSLFAMYPYASQVNGEMGIQADIMYKIKKNTLLGGKYGMDLKLNYSKTMSIDKSPVNTISSDSYEGTLGYNSNFFSIGKESYYEEYNLELTRKLSKDLKLNFMYSYQIFNPIAFGHDGDAFVYANVFALDATQKLGKNSLRGELQWLITEQNYGDWAKGDWLQGTLEYNIKGNWFIAISDQWNYGNKYEDKVHYYNIACGYNKGSNRVSLSYGKQRNGIICIGGVCREMPAFNGLFFTITSSF